MKYTLAILVTIVLVFAACQRDNGKVLSTAEVEKNYLEDPLILPIAKEYYQGKKPSETPQTLDMLDSLFIQDSMRLRFYFAATTKLLGQEMNFRDIVSLYAYKFVLDRPLMFIAQFTKDNPLLDPNAAWQVWCLNVAYESMIKDPANPFDALDAIEASMKSRFRTVGPNAMEMGATFIENTRAKIIKLRFENDALKTAPTDTLK